MLPFTPTADDFAFHRDLAAALGITVEELYAQAGVAWVQSRRPHRKVVQPKGFAVMSLAARQRIARLGGKAAHAKGVAHHFTPETASEAGKAAQVVLAAKRATVSDTPQADKGLGR